MSVVEEKFLCVLEITRAEKYGECVISRDDLTGRHKKLQFRNKTLYILCYVRTEIGSSSDLFRIEDPLYEYH